MPCFFVQYCVFVGDIIALDLHTDDEAARGRGVADMLETRSGGEPFINKGRAEIQHLLAPPRAEGFLLFTAAIEHHRQRDVYTRPECLDERVRE